MKYRLKRDLPFAKAGTEVIAESDVIENTSCDRFAVKVDDMIAQYSYRFIGYVQEKDRLIKEGWIEEIKPREFTVRIHNGRIITSDCPYTSEIIKVREIIED